MTQACTRLAYLAAIVLTAAVAIGGCASQGHTDQSRRELPLEQRYPLETVQLRAQDLEPGMARADVFLLLGSPAQYRDNAWIYRGDGGTLTVRFRQDRYVEHELD